MDGENRAVWWVVALAVGGVGLVALAMAFAYRGWSAAILR